MGERAHGSERLDEISRDFLLEAVRTRYVYNFTWLGRPIIQLPQDILAMQEIIHQVRPDLIVETGIAHGGALVFYSSMLDLVDVPEGLVVGVDVEIRPHNRAALEAHPTFGRMRLIEGSSTDPAVVAQVRALARGRRRILVTLDSSHTHDHVLRELELYSPLVTRGSYLVVFDTAVEQLPKELYPDRPWGPGNSPLSAVQSFLRTSERFVVDRAIDQKLALTAAPGGYLRCVAD
jgi:cephalosporin hydroxylase